MRTIDPVTVRGLEVFAPVATQFGGQPIPLAPRLASLAGHTIGLLWNGKANGDVALKRVGELIQQREANVTLRFYQGSLPCKSDLLDRCVAECDAIVACTAD